MPARIRERSKERHGHLLVIGPTPARDAWNQVKWQCKCDCGATVLVGGRDLRVGRQYCGHKCPLLLKKLRREGRGLNSWKIARWGEVAMRMREEGAKFKDIALVVGVSSQRVQQVVNKLYVLRAKQGGE